MPRPSAWSRRLIVGKLDMELNKAFEFAVIQAWEDLVGVSEPRCSRVEYRCKVGTSLDSLGVWSVREGGRQDRVCEYQARTSPAHSGGSRFANGYHSDKLAWALEFILKNQDQFTRRACGDGLVVIYPPAADESEEAVTWTARVPRGATRFSGGAEDRRLPLLLPSIATGTQGSPVSGKS